MRHATVAKRDGLESFHLSFPCLSRRMGQFERACVAAVGSYRLCAMSLALAGFRHKDTELPDACQVHNGSYAGADACVMVL